MTSRWPNLVAVVGPILILAAVHFCTHRYSEPYYNNDETRHVMTGVFFHDLFTDRPVTDLPDYAVRYYVQYPALGLLVWPPFFYVVEGQLLIDLEDRTLDLRPRQGVVVPKGVVHRTRAPERTVILMMENNTIVPTGD